MSGNTAPSPDEEVTLRTSVLLLLMDGLNMILQLMSEREALATLTTGERLDPVSRVEAREVTAEVERRGELVRADLADVLSLSVTEGVLPQRPGVLERLPAGLADTEPDI